MAARPREGLAPERTGGQIASPSDYPRPDCHGTLSTYLVNERSPFRVLFWCFAVATILAFGYIGLAGGPEEVDPLWAGGFGLCLGATVLALAADGAATGRIRVKRRHAHRDERPVTFWAVVTLYGTAGAAIVGAALWHLVGG